MPPILYLINAITLGYCVTLASFLLNFDDGNKTGMLLVIIAWAAGYFSDSTYAYGTNYPRFVRALQYITIAATTLSVAVWYF